MSENRVIIAGDIAITYPMRNHLLSKHFWSRLHWRRGYVQSQNSKYTFCILSQHFSESPYNSINWKHKHKHKHSHMILNKSKQHDFPFIKCLTHFYLLLCCVAFFSLLHTFIPYLSAWDLAVWQSNWKYMQNFGIFSQYSKYSWSVTGIMDQNEFCILGVSQRHKQFTVLE